ncbi:MAG: CapA family protein [Thermaurantiacus sp.]
MHGRRDVLAGSAAMLLGVAGAAHGARGGGPLRLHLLGQSLIRANLCAQDWPARAALAELNGRAHATFSNLEVAIRGPREGPPTRALDTLHVADPGVLDCLSALGIDLLSTSNNHAFDIGTGGILDAIEALEARGLAFAGTGRDLAAASAPAILQTAAGRVGLVAAAAGFVRAGGSATPGRAGVHEIRQHPDGRGLHPEDSAAMLHAIAHAGSQADVVIAYLHNHYWEPENWQTADWARAFARECIDAGAHVFVSHGAPLLHGVEMYRGRPLFHGLGSFIFQTKKEPGFYGPWAWQSILADCRFEAGRFVSAELIPVQLNATGVGGDADLETRGRPALAAGRDAEAIVARLEALSAALGHRLDHDGRVARLRP